MKNFEGRFYNVTTYGCQMNVHESEKIRAELQSLGMLETNNVNDAMIIVFNTCCVREGAEDRAFNNIVALQKIKEENPEKIIIVCGCMPQQKNGKYNLFERLPFVDIIIGTHNINALANYIKTYVKTQRRIIDIVDKPTGKMDFNKPVRDDKLNAYVNIIYGCDKYCTYCIVPYVRGKETSRQPKEIYEEVKDLVQNQGYKYITLLGQNVNSYGKDLAEAMSFSELLSFLCTIEGDFKIKFMTSHPMDFDDNLIKVMKNEPKVAKTLHLPVQSGSDKILQKMNRHYNIKRYKSIIRKIRRAIPNISVSTDIIVGFPGEDEKDYNKTLKLLKKIKYDQVFAFAYSKRSGTPATEFEGQLTEKEKNARLNKLLRTQKIIQKDNIKKYFNKTYDCLIQQKNGVALGLTDGGKEIYIPNYKYFNQNYFAQVKVIDVRNHKLSGIIK